MTYQRPLSAAQAKECENALYPTCKCRCGGAMHGAARMGQKMGDSTSPKASPDDVRFFEQLPPTDPHHLPTRAERKDAERWRKRVKGYERSLASLKRSLAGAIEDSYAEWLKKEIADTEAHLEALLKEPPLAYRKHDPNAGGKVIDLMAALKESLANAETEAVATGRAPSTGYFDTELE
jgi:hypothetical protein